MTTLIHADIFFFIASIGFGILFVLGIIATIFVIGILRNVKRITASIEGDVERLSGDATEFIADVRRSMLYRMLFGRRRNSKK